MPRPRTVTKQGVSEAQKITRNLRRVGIEPTHQMLTVLLYHPALADCLYRASDSATFLREAGLSR